ncbi:hypothetical protein [Psittacicella gerlachiana]|uniref:Lipoprotein n=1 Tax=Psittacicella gerlachiana TaxID=2028574 RepID=A0A3A1YI05_9GAMM|nr:hypothetical protein [Psittacicella gerlachiana]RIY35864.1 hypothetical protein CKF59_03125 [Psittacicella gerlachiana]
MKKLILVLGGAGLLSSCTALDIGHNQFYCQEQGVTCVSASTYLQQNPKPVVYSQLPHTSQTPVLLSASPDLEQYLQIWFAPYKLGEQVYPSQILLIPYIH